MLFTAELRRRLPADCGVVAAAVHPGEVMTDVVRTLPAPLQVTYRTVMRPFCLSPAEGAPGAVPRLLSKKCRVCALHPAQLSARTVQPPRPADLHPADLQPARLWARQAHRHRQ